MDINKLNIRLAIASLFVLAGGLLCFFFLGHDFLRWIYEGNAPGILGRAIQGQSVHPLNFYWQAALSFILKLSIYSLITILVFLFLSRLCFPQRSERFYAITLAFLFLISVSLRLPYLDRPLSEHHGWITAHTMMVLDNWNSQGALKHKFCLLTTYPEESNRWIINPCGRLLDEDGKGYYASFAPFSVIVVYVFFKLFSIPLTVFNVQLFNLVWHFIAVLFIYRILLLTLRKSNYNHWAAFIGSVFFIFLPANLWFFGNIYSWDIFWHYLWIIGIYWIMRLIDRLNVRESSSDQNPINTLDLIILSVITALMIYTEFTGLLYAFSVVLYAFFHIKQQKEFKWIIVSVIVGVLLSSGLLMWQ